MEIADRRGEILKERLVYWLGTGFGSGLFPRIPGTAGSAVALVLAGGLSYIAGENHRWVMPMLAAGATLGGVALGNYASGKIFKHPDPPEFVIDEFAGIFVAVSLFSYDGTSRSTLLYLSAFFFFRLFDIWKPFPINHCQSLPGGWGIVMDDIGAGFYTLFILFFLHRYVAN